MGQASYTMSNITVTDCYGLFLDSENGQNPGHYAHNEDLTFRICPPSATQISLSFTQFCTEAILDKIRFFDGPDTNSPLILTHSGTSLPGTIVANSGCLTIHFKSDANVSCTGWQANWSVQLAPPTPPQIDPNATFSCFSNQILMTLDQSIPCDSVYTSAFSISGPSNPMITNAQPTNCVGGMTNAITLTLNPAFSDNGQHTVTFEYNYRDVCDSVWHFTIQQTFDVTDCPITAEITATEDTICLGECTSLTGSATGGDPTTYAYAWSNGLPNTPGPHVVCPTTTTTYYLTVSDAGPSPSDVASQTIYVFPKPNAGADQTVCLFSGMLNLNGSPAGGSWSGSGVISSSGIFHSDTAGVGTHNVLYTVNGCADTVQITVLMVYAGPDEAACPGAAPFQVTGGFPLGGTWSGIGITPGGQFNPVNPGSFVVTYNAPNGCTHSKVINVDTITVQSDDTTCTNLNTYYLSFMPYGGLWSGPGITNAYDGAFSPTLAGNGLHTLTYTLRGCSKTVDLFVQPINAGPNRVYCPFQAPLQIPPASPPGGYWTGFGIIDSIQGIFDPGADNFTNFNCTAVYHVGGCTDTAMLYVRETTVGIDTLFFCYNDTVTPLNWVNVRRNPGNGNWSGPGIIDPNYPGRFDPEVSGPGVHTLIYDANTCVDSMVMVVYPRPQTQGDTIVCETQSAFQLQTLYPGGVWSGTGVTDPVNGIFDPQVTGLGDFDVVYSHFLGCTDTMTVTVDPLVNINITPIAPFHCYKDTVISLSANPAGGVFSGPGVSGSSFNPSVADTGVHTIMYQFGTGDCATFDSIFVEVGDPIQVAASFAVDSICFGEYSQLSVTASGGQAISYTYTWSNGLGTGRMKSVNPAGTTTYYVTVTDGCSEPVVTSQTVYVHPEINVGISTSPKVCQGIKGWAQLSASPGKQYSYVWDTDPVRTTDSIQAFAGSYWVTVTDDASGCTKEYQPTIPGYTYVNANFTPSPNTDCVSYLNPVFDFLDNSTGGVQGTWSFGDGVTRAYQPGDLLTHRYSDTGRYIVSLQLVNEGGCKDSFAIELCVEPEYTLYVPNGFTPNGDGLNDVFRAKGIGITEYRLMIFNRWGQKLFESNNIDIGWDGTYNGEKVQNDVYTYLIVYRDITGPNTKAKKGVVAIIR